jgi:chromosome segregation ATPase
MDSVPSSGAAESNLRMSLFSRYTSLGDETNAMRKKRDALQDELDKLNEDELAMVEQETDLKRMTEDAERGIQSFYAKKKEIEEDFDKAKEALHDATVDRDAARRRKENLDEHIAQGRQAFLKSSVEFRSACKRLGLSAASCGLVHASMQAFMASKGLDDSIYDTLSDIAMDSDNLDDEPSTWKAMDPNDKEMMTQMNIYLEKKAEHDNVQAELAKAESSKQFVRTRIDERESAKTSLKNQADKIANDNTELELQIKKMHRLITEVKEKTASIARRSKSSTMVH